MLVCLMESFVLKDIISFFRNGNMQITLNMCTKYEKACVQCIEFPIEMLGISCWARSARSIFFLFVKRKQRTLVKRHKSRNIFHSCCRHLENDIYYIYILFFVNVKWQHKFLKDLANSKLAAFLFFAFCQLFAICGTSFAVFTSFLLTH